MSDGLSAIVRGLTDCGCCEGVSASTPRLIFNRPGLPAVSYRAGTHAQFKESLLARISGSRLPLLRQLRVRDDEDFSIALLDAWAVIADVLTFYQERIANESYLRTATERRSLIELARLIDYRLRPGVAARTDLAFTVEEAPGALGQVLAVGTTAQRSPAPPPPVIVPVGAKVQSVPGPGEQAQTFETVAEIEARAEWSAMRPRLTQPQLITVSTTSVTLSGTDTNLKPGDWVVIVTSDGERVPRKVRSVRPDDAAKTTRVRVTLPPESPAVVIFTPGKGSGSFGDFPGKTGLGSGVISTIAAKTWNMHDLFALSKIQGWAEADLTVALGKKTAAQPTGAAFYALRQRAAVFGHNAPKWSSLPGNLRFGERLVNEDNVEIPVPPAFPDDWEGTTLEDNAEASGGLRSIYLDNAYPAVVGGSLLVLSNPFDQEIYDVAETLEVSRSDFAISAKVSKLRVEASSAFPANFQMRNTSVYAQSELLTLAEAPIETAVKGESVTLDRAYLSLKSGQSVIVTGEREDLPGVVPSEARTLKEVALQGGFTVLTFDQSLTYAYIRSTVTVNANVARATHGETVEEALGGGDATRRFQTFTLRQSPLTYVGASTPSGVQSTLEVRVNDILWTEVASLYGAGPNDHVYVTRTSDDGRTSVTFGDGRTGARLPTGQENVRARYRKGIGAAGLVKADQLTQLMTRPAGLKSVTNPNAAEAAGDPEKLEDARRNATLTIMTLERVVSLQDYEDFARAFAGIGKALATWTWNGQTRGVFLTVAGVNGADVPEGSELSSDLLKAIRSAGDAAVPLAIASYGQRFFRIAAGLRVDPAFEAEKVLADVETSLREHFAFEPRAFGQPVALSEVIALMQQVKGVVAVDVDALYRSDEAEQRATLVPAAKPRPGSVAVVPAELLTLDPRPVDLEVLA